MAYCMCLVVRVRVIVKITIYHILIYEFAFQVAKAFWTAIGGDDDEIDGLSSGEES